MPLSSHAVFPQIVFERIIDHLSDDRQTLANCILVCREWVEPCQRHFFSQMILTRNNWPAFRDHLHANARYLLIKRAERLPPKSLRGQTLVQTLGMLSSGLWDLLNGRCGPETILPVEDLMHSTFPQATVLIFEPPQSYYPEVTEQQQFVRGLASAFPRVRILELKGNVVYGGFHRPCTWADTIQFVCGFRDLEVLTLDYLQCDLPFKGNVQGCRLPLGLRTLNLLCFTQATSLFLDLLYSMGPPPKITTFRITSGSAYRFYTPFTVIGRVSTLLSEQGKYIRRLEFIDRDLGSLNFCVTVQVIPTHLCSRRRRIHATNYRPKYRPQVSRHTNQKSASLYLPPTCLHKEDPTRRGADFVPDGV